MEMDPKVRASESAWGVVCQSSNKVMAKELGNTLDTSICTRIRVCLGLYIYIYIYIYVCVCVYVRLCI